MRKSCAVCGTEFEAKRATAKYCGATCRQRAHRRPEAAPEPAVLAFSAEKTSETTPLSAIGVTAATVAVLERAGRLESPAGQAALALAHRIDFAMLETGTAVAAMVREHRAALAEAVQDAEKAADPLDELRARREGKRNAG